MKWPSKIKVPKGLKNSNRRYIWADNLKKFEAEWVETVNKKNRMRRG